MFQQGAAVSEVVRRVARLFRGIRLDVKLTKSAKARVPRAFADLRLRGLGGTRAWQQALAAGPAPHGAPLTRASG